MKNPTEIKRLAYERLAEAEILCAAAKYDGAFYLAGYSIELMLKAKVCEHLGIDNLFDEQPKAVVYGVSEVRKALKTHDIAVLLIFSSLKTKFETEKGVSKILMQTYTRLFELSGRCLWNEQVRYQAVGTQNAEEVIELIALLQHQEGLIKWIETN